MRYPASEKREIIGLVKRSHLPVRRALDELSPVREILTLGSVSGDWKRGHRSRTEVRSETDGTATGPLKLARKSSNLLRLYSLNSA